MTTSARPFANAHRLPMQDGGGVVFPKGFYGPGFRLPEWEFIRYCARADHQDPKVKPETWWQRHMEGPSFIGGVIWYIAGRIANAYLEPYVGQGTLTSLFLLYIGFLFYRGLFSNFHAEPRSFVEDYPSAERLSVFSHWWDHIRASMITGKETNIFGLLWQSTVFAILGLGIYVLYVAGTIHPLLGICLTPAIVVMAGYQLAIAASVLVTYAKLRRRPTFNDLRPL